MFARAAKFLTSSSLLISLNGALIVIFGSLLYEIQVNPELTLAAFLATFSVYNLNKATDKVEDSVNRPETASKSSAYYVGASILAMLVSLGIGALNGLPAFLVLIFPIIVGLFYSVKISQKLPRLKEVLGAKSILVALTWSIDGTFLPLSTQSISFEKVTLVFTYIFIQVIVYEILLDSLDKKGDSVLGIKTIPIVLEQKKTRVLLFLTNSGLILWLTFCELEGLFIKFIPALLLGAIFGYAIIWRFLGNKRRTISTEIIIDGKWLLIVPVMILSII